MRTLGKRFVAWLSKSPSPFLKTYAGKYGRTIPRVVDASQLPQGKGGLPTLNKFEIPYSTWEFEIRNTGLGAVFITFENGTTISMGGIAPPFPLVDKITFPGTPFLERDDRIKLIQFELATGEIQVLFHRVIVDVTK